MEPEVARHLIFGEVDTRHVHYHLPMAFDKAVGQLAAGSHVHNVQLLRREMFLDGVPEQLWIVFAMESLGKTACSGAKQIKCLLDGGFGECLQRKDPALVWCAVDKDNDVACALTGNGVTGTDVNVNLDKALVRLVVN